MSEDPPTGGLELSGLSKSFGSREAVKSVSLRVNAGEVLALFGRNGAGKSTLIRLAAGVARPDAGTVRIGGVGMATDPSRAKRKVGWVADQPMLYEALTPAENVAFFGELYGLSSSAARERSAALLDRLGIAHRSADPTGSLSLGMRQRVALARALVHEPAVLLLDEPFESLDPQGQEALLELLRSPDAREGRAVLLTTQHLELGLQLADHVGVMDRGALVKLSPREAVSTVSLLRDLRKSGGGPAAG